MVTLVTTTSIVVTLRKVEAKKKLALKCMTSGLLQTEGVNFKRHDRAHMTKIVAQIPLQNKELRLCGKVLQNLASSNLFQRLKVLTLST